MMELSWVVTYNRERRSILVSAPQRRKLKSGIVGTQMADCHLAFIGQSLLKFQIVLLFCCFLSACYLLVLLSFFVFNLVICLLRDSDRQVDRWRSYRTVL